MAWYDSAYDSAVEFFSDDDKDTKDTKSKEKTKGKEEKSWYDDLGWDDVGEALGGLFGDDEDDTTANSGRTQQPNQTAKDNHGNAVTGGQPAGSKDNTMLYVGGGLAVLVLVGVVAVVVSK